MLGNILMAVLGFFAALGFLGFVQDKKNEAEHGPLTPEEKEEAWKAEKARQNRVLENVVNWGDTLNRVRYMDEDGK
ncbi:MAG: hypothetical protein IJL66_00525 [Lachnospiraceae bacterium]|nr:hypothetical protein [Lachnospiraceae bacterium]